MTLKITIRHLERRFYAFYELNGAKLTFHISFVKRIQNDVQDNGVRDSR